MLRVLSRVCCTVFCSRVPHSGSLKTPYLQSVFALNLGHSSVARAAQNMDECSSERSKNVASKLCTGMEELTVEDFGNHQNKQKSPEGDSRSDHLTRTSDNTRDAGVYSVIVHELKALSPSVIEVVLQCEQKPPAFTFKAGQWVDLFIPNLETVGGFSMFSSPTELNENNQLKLAVKYSTHPPALWMHDQCKIGDKLQVRVGGDFYYLGDNSGHDRPIMLIAGGVGINPLCSIIRYIEQCKRVGVIRKSLPLCLLYSSKIKDELIFKDEFDNFASVDENFLPLYYTTNTQSADSDESESNVHSRRIGRSDLERALCFLTQTSEKTPTVDAYMCGPPPMIKTITAELRSLKVDNIHFEQWW
ncbi:Oxidoreductase NAD-binding domain-containing protein 1 [Orchesella cincta]|uniref:Oxidoreductase NAD-binding domain-containing protein 1 n=1 Tax=Orchesella cincta TaxID=48709 RepID=A0A1D2N6F9_ORCCI|nr:Oxidoreductase NAD-binding domain-containing protein 1 [Orchesella cincta]